MTAAQMTTGDSGARSSSRLVHTLAVTVLLQWMGATAIVPMLPVYVRHLGGSDAVAGVVMAAFYAAGVLFQYPAGKLADRFGRRPVLVGGLLTYGVASFSFLLPTGASAVIGLRFLQGLGAGAATVAALAMVSGSVAADQRGRAFAAVYSGELAGMAVGPLVGSIVGVRFMWVMFLVSGILSTLACVPALFVAEPGPRSELRHQRPPVREPLRVGIRASTAGALICAGVIGLTTGVYDICWTLLLVERGAPGWAIGISWTLFAVPFVLVSRPSGWLADHMDRRALVLGGLGVSTALCATYPFLHSVTLLVTLGAFEAVGFAAAMPAVQSLLTERALPSEVGRTQGLFATAETAFTALSAALAGAAFGVAIWLPFLTVAGAVTVALVVVVAVWRRVPGRVDRPGPHPSAGEAAVTASVLAQATEVVASAADGP